MLYQTFENADLKPKNKLGLIDHAPEAMVKKTIKINFVLKICILTFD